MIPSYSIEIEFEKGTENPERVFSTMLGLISAFKEFDRNLVQIISADFEPEIILEDITTGSIRTRIISIIKNIDDGAIKELDWKQLIGAFLVKGKYKLIKFLEERETVSKIKEIEDLSLELVALAKEKDIIYLPSYSPVPPVKLLENLRDISSSMSSLSPKDKVALLTDDTKIEINKKFHLPPEKIEEILTEKIYTHERELILKVKKPDFLGFSKWDMKHNSKAISVKIGDTEWLNNFHRQEVSVLPGDSLRGLVKITESVDKNGQIVTEEYSVNKVSEVIKNISYQRGLF